MMYKMIFLFVGVLALVGFGSAQITQVGQCETITLMNDFNLNSFIGTWYELGKSSTQNADCSTLQFTSITGGISVSNPSVVNNFLQTATGTAVHTTGTSILTLTLTSSNNPIDFRILNTDYTNYAVAFNCVNLGNLQRSVNIWLLGRATNSFDTAATLTLANTALATLGTSVAELPSIDHSVNACTQLPVIGAGQPVILTGQCTTTPPPVAAFRVADFTGTWHEISSYYSVNALGTCARASYELVGSTVNVVNSQVLNGRLDTVTGTATLVGTDGAGRLSVVLNVQGTLVTQELIVVDTDYTGYAVSYTCVNLANNQKQVNSWILSRTRQIPAASQTEVDRVINSYVDLNTAYYQTTDQSDNGCFYYPVFQPGVPVVFPGQCDANIPVQANFDPTQYVGLWHDIQSYPSTFQQGTCNNAFYTLTPQGTVDVFNTQVINQRLDTMSGVAVIPDATQPAKLLVSFPIAGTDQTTSTDYWILATDYVSYSLVYSCINLPNNERTVFSWKLSRTKALTAQANQAIDAVIATIPVLDSQYFPNRDQSDNGCFYYPVFQPGVPVVFPGQCDANIPVQANFDPTQYVGLWHDIQSYPSTFQQGTCNNAFYTLTPQGTVDVFNTQVINQRLDTMSGVAVIPDATQPAKLLVSFPIAGTDQTTSTDYWILATDYVSYSLVYSCINLPNNERTVFSWKLSRTKALTAQANQAIDAVIATIPVLDSQYFPNRDQSDNGCFYYPVFQPGVPVVFPGQCDANIPVQANFDPTQYVGLWHDIQSYPSSFQQGTCNNAFYTLTPQGTVDVFNTQVINQRLDTMSGIAVIPDATQPAKLLVSFPIAGTDQTTSTDYWILATDYVSYSLVYSCINLPNNERTVFSWKLSRTKALTAQANQAIDAVIATIPVLDSQYFPNRDQSVNGCFYFPDAVPGTPVVFPGQCDETISAVSSFSLTQFAGVWHEIEAYPKEQQTGTCVNHEFTAGVANGLNLVSNQVVNERPTSASGNVVLDTTDGSGRLLLSMTVNGQSINFPYWILATDYSSYALVYSCININSDFRSIHSWKLSRTQTLPALAATAINTAIATVQVLDNIYFEPVGQTSNDCFYYPVFGENPESIILSGSCPTISGKANFVPADYLGNWYDVASYPFASQNGTCSRAEYTLVDGVITIRNTRVVDEELRTQLGIARLSSAGTGQLQVTIVMENGEEVVATYYILETDYTTFSLVYNCRNLEDGRRQVYSWKLSRTPTLTANANAIINNIISNTQGLLEEYYQPTSQTAQDCFYVPEPVTGQSVLFRGACGTVTGMQGLNVNQYLGWWHEIERYPTDDIPGECISATFRQTGNLVQVVETSIDGLTSNETTSTAVIATDGSITITRDGGTTVWYVLATDYTSYSLLYSCETVSTSWGNYRRVWSAKHSKARSLTTAAQTAMTPIITANEVLHQDLYQNVNQSDSACFHYREDANAQVILSGQCDTGIPVTADFDASRFTGTWYQLERYPYPQVSNEGTCVGTRYTANSDGLTVLNWEVLGGTLNTIEGTATIDAATATLAVTLPVQGTEETTSTNLRILLTDYDNYALAYTCVNINAFQRTVGAFKLSRSRTMSNEGQVAIDNYIDLREELHQPYFISIPHDDECLEPSSALLVKSSLIIMLVCIVLQLVM